MHFFPSIFILILVLIQHHAVAYLNFNVQALPSQFRYLSYHDKTRNLIQLEIRNKGVRGILGRILPRFMKPKALAKAGFRPQSIPSTGMLDTFINTNFNNNISVNNDNDNDDNNDDNNERNRLISVFVYVWVDPKLRKQGLADYLLHTSAEMSKNRGDSYMLLVHDDNGSGKLIDYYTDRGFIGCENIIEKGLLAKL